jgi:hypothetical protein
VEKKSLYNLANRKRGSRFFRSPYVSTTHVQARFLLGPKVTSVLCKPNPTAPDEPGTATWPQHSHRPLTALMKKTNQPLADFIIPASAPITDLPANKPSRPSIISYRYGHTERLLLAVRSAQLGVFPFCRLQPRGRHASSWRGKKHG